MDLLNNYVPKPILNGFENTVVRPTFTKGRVILQFPEYEGILEIRFYDILGRVVYTETTTFPFIDIRLNVPNGSYIIDVFKEGERVYERKIIINSASPYGASLNIFNNYGG